MASDFAFRFEKFRRPSTKLSETTHFQLAFSITPPETTIFIAIHCNNPLPPLANVDEC